MKLISFEGFKRFMFLEDKSLRDQYKEEAFNQMKQEEFRTEAMLKF